MSNLDKTIEIFTACYPCGCDDLTLAEILDYEGEDNFRKGCEEYEDIFQVIEVSTQTVDSVGADNVYIILSIDGEFYKIPGWGSSWGLGFNVGDIYKTEKKTRTTEYWS